MASNRRQRRLQQKLAGLPAGVEELRAGNERLRRGDPRGAIVRYRRSIQLAPSNAAAHDNLGIALERQGRLDEAVQSYRQAITIDPARSATYSNLGGALRLLGDHGDAVAAYRKAVELDPNSSPALNNLANGLQAQGELDEAVSYYRDACAVDPNNAEAQNNLAAALLELGQLAEAASACRSAIKLAPRFAEAHNNLGDILKEQGWLQEAVAAYQRAVALDPKNALWQCNLGRAFFLQGAHQEALSRYQHALEAAPSNASIHEGIGTVLRECGRADEALGSFQNALELAPKSVSAWFSFSQQHEFAAGDPELERLEALLGDADLSSDQRSLVLFALGKAYDDLGDYAEAFSRFRAGNEEKGSGITYDPAKFQEAVSRIRDADFEPASRVGQATGESGRPIFIVGLSRSGKTLVESVLARDPRVYAAGEIGDWANGYETVTNTRLSLKNVPRDLERMSAGDLQKIGEAYLKRVTALSSGRAFVTNTLPGNSSFIGLIFRALPEAKIVYCDRDPLDHCLQIYFKHYAKGNRYAYRMEDVASHFVATSDLMRHWLDLYGDRIHSVKYEDLLEDPLSTCTRLAGYCGLDVDADAIVNGLHHREVGRWRRYDDYLSPLRASLGSLGHQTET